MFSSFSTRDRLRRSMSTRSMRKSHRVPDAEPVDPDIAKVLATSAASHAMRSSGRSSTDSKTSYDKLGGPGNVAVPKRRPNSSLQWTEDSASVAGSSIAPPVTPRQSVETTRAGQLPNLENSAALPPIEEFRGLDGRDSSVPSSYRRLRKAKSMFSTRQHPSPSAYGAPPLPRQDSYDPSRSPRFELPRTMRHSVSFIRGTNRQGSRLLRHAKSQDAAIQLARCQFLDDSNDTSPQFRRSSLFLYRRKREHKPFRKTFRVTSEGAIDAHSPSGQPNPQSPYSKSRTFSASIKRGLRRVFGMTKPVEQDFVSHDDLESVSPTLAAPPDVLVVKGHVQDLEETNVAEKGRFRQPNSFAAPPHSPSRDSLCTSTSRVTSWADSTVANTATTRKAGHRQSLSLIEEREDINQQLPQSSVRNGFDHQPLFQRRQDPRDSNRLVNSQDLYSALMQQMGRATAHDEDIVFGTVPEYRVIPERSSSVYSHRSRRTIRHVPSPESSASPGSFATARGDSLTPQRHARFLRNVPQKATGFATSQENRRPHLSHPSGKSPRSAYVIDEESNENTGSVIVAGFGDSGLREISPTSVYSRSTGDANSSKKSTDGIAEALEVGEPGTATIFASQRTTYSSPSRTNESITSKGQVQPSADWQQWMSSQIERIEKASPTRKHVREDSQFEDDDEVFTEMVRRAPVVASGPTDWSRGAADQARNDVHPAEPKTCSQNNFSRPFSRSSSVRTILSSQKVEPERTINDTSQPDSDAPTGLAANASSIGGQISSGLSPMRTRSANLIQMPDSPTPRRTNAAMQKRTWTQEQYRRYSARRPMVKGTANQFRSMRTYRDFGELNNENMKQQEEHDEMMSEYHKLQDTHSTISSKRMVEMFLDSRRRPGGMDEPEAVAVNEAFI